MMSYLDPSETAFERRGGDSLDRDPGRFHRHIAKSPRGPLGHAKDPSRRFPRHGVGPHSIPIGEGAVGPPRSGFVLRLCIRKADGAWGEAALGHGLADTRFCKRRIALTHASCNLSRKSPLSPARPASRPNGASVHHLTESALVASSETNGAKVWTRGRGLSSDYSR